MLLKGSIPRWLLALALVTVATSLPAAADEFTLKDGQKINGTIVGYEGNMFRVQTDYGYVLIRKDKVVSIRVEGKPEEPGSDSKPNPANSGPAAPASPTPTPKPAPPLVSRPLNEPLPAHLREHIDGNDYVNDTLQFTMYKPPGWKLMEDLHREKVSAVVAMSSPDELTLLFVDRQVWSGAPVLSDDRVEANLRLSYENYRKLSESSMQVDGLPAIRRSFTGVIDRAEWHGVSVHVALGNTVFSLIGLTSAETYQFQEAIFNKIIKSFHFLAARSAVGTGHTAPGVVSPSDRAPHLGA